MFCVIFPFHTNYIYQCNNYYLNRTDTNRDKPRGVCKRDRQTAFTSVNNFRLSNSVKCFHPFVLMATILIKTYNTQNTHI